MLLQRVVVLMAISIAMTSFSTGCTDQRQVRTKPVSPVEESTAVTATSSSPDLAQNAPRNPAEIHGLPKELNDDLKVLLARFSDIPKATPDTKSEGYTVKYYRGTYHTHHGLLEVGSDERPDPPADKYVTEHCFDINGRLIKAIGRAENGTRSVKRAFHYEGDRPAAMLTFGPEGYQFGDYGLYKNGQLVLVARIDAKDRLLFCEHISYDGDRAQSVRYVSKRRSAVK